MDITQRREIPPLLLQLVPESGQNISAAAGGPAEEVVAGEFDWIDFYDFLSSVFYRGLLLPELQNADPDADLLDRCFKFVEILLASPIESISTGAYFETLEPLFENESLLVSAFPLLGVKSRGLVRTRLDETRLSEAARQKLSPFM